MHYLQVDFKGALYSVLSFVPRWSENIFYSANFFLNDNGEYHHESEYFALGLKTAASVPQGKPYLKS